MYQDGHFRRVHFESAVSDEVCLNVAAMVRVTSVIRSVAKSLTMVLYYLSDLMRKSSLCERIKHWLLYHS